VLFQYHPHPKLERAILVEDARRAAAQGLVFTDRIVSETAPAAQPDYDQGWMHADHIICASSFTKRSLCEVGAPGDRISVIPYGVDVPDGPVGAAPRDFHVLFVGSGIQRKGLHHLLDAWRAAGLTSPGARLTVVSRVIETALANRAGETPGVTLLRGASQPELDRLYAEATLFCMPSLVEGFGQVYLEALSHGLPVLGTPNTCLPDLGQAQDGIFTVEAGDVAALAKALTELATSLPGNQAIRQAARRSAGRFTWSEFRRKIVCVIDSLESTRNGKVTR